MTEPKKQSKIPTRGRTFTGIIVSSKAQKTVTVSWDRRVFIPKYERYLTKRSKVKAHNPDLNLKEGDMVMIKECRPISKTKKFVVVEVIK